MGRWYLNFQKTNCLCVCLSGNGMVWCGIRYSPSTKYPSTKISILTQRQRAMDTLLHSPSSMAKRPCPSQNLRILNPNQFDFIDIDMDVDHLLETLILRYSSFESSSSPSSSSIGRSFERLLDSRASDSDQTQLIDGALELGYLLLEAGNRSARKRASKHNSLAWALPADLTIKVWLCQNHLRYLIMHFDVVYVILFLFRLRIGNNVCEIWWLRCLILFAFGCFYGNLTFLVFELWFLLSSGW